MSNSKSIPKVKQSEPERTKIELTISNSKIVNFFNNNKSLDIENLIIWVVDLLNNVLTENTTLGPNISNQIFNSINNQNNEFIKLINMMNIQSENYKSEINSLKDICKLTNQNITNEISNIKTLLDFNFNATHDIYFNPPFVSSSSLSGYPPNERGQPGNV
jgi:hypothetical protein